MGRGDVIEPLPALGSLGREIELPRGNSTHRRSPPNEAAPPGSRRPDRERHMRAKSLTEHLDRAISGQFEGEVRIGQDEQQWVEGGPPRLHSQGSCAPKAGIGKSSRRAYEWYLAEVKPERLIS